MAIKTVKLDDEAYEERQGPAKRSTARDVLQAAREANFSEDTLDRLEEVVQARTSARA